MTHQSSLDTYKTLTVGDIVETKRTHKVTDTDGEWAKIEDVKSGRRFTLYRRELDESTLRLALVKKAKRIYQAGDTLTGAELVDHMWKRGTIVQYETHNAAGQYVLLGEGYWINTSFDGSHHISFGSMGSCGGTFTLIHVATSPNPQSLSVTSSPTYM